jgi:hypothetical protein
MYLEREKKMVPSSDVWTTELPDGFFKGKQLEQFKLSDGLITKTVGEVMEELGLDRYRLDRDFQKESLPFPLGSNRQLIYTLQFDSGNSTTADHIRHRSFFDNTVDETVDLLYHPISFMNIADSLSTGIVPLLIPVSSRRKEWYYASEAISLMQRPDSYKLVRAHVETDLYSLNRESIRDLLTIIAINRP